MVKAMCSELERGAQTLLHDHIRADHGAILSPENPIGADMLLRSCKDQHEFDLHAEINESFSTLNEENCCALMERIERDGLKQVVLEETTEKATGHLESVELEKTWSHTNLMALEAAAQAETPLLSHKHRHHRVETAAEASSDSELVE
jgi:hypothetical protein